MTSSPLNAGREMDIAIAEKVMGLPCVDAPPGSGRDCPLHGCPAYSTDIAAAWQIVEKMRENGWTFEFSNQDIPCAAFWARYARASRSLKSDSSAPLAICRASLAALSATEAGR